MIANYWGDCFAVEISSMFLRVRAAILSHNALKRAAYFRFKTGDSTKPKRLKPTLDESLILHVSIEPSTTTPNIYETVKL